METWIDIINEQIGSEIWQMELLCREVFESLLIVLVCAVPILFCVVWLLAALDYMFTKNRDIPQSLDEHKTTDRYNESSRDRFSRLATRLLRKQTNAAA